MLRQRQRAFTCFSLFFIYIFFQAAFFKSEINSRLYRLIEVVYLFIIYSISPNSIKTIFVYFQMAMMQTQKDQEPPTQDIKH